MQDDRTRIRPEIITEKEATTGEERFQNHSLRPILKMQNDLLVAAFRHFMQKRRVKFDEMQPKQKAEQIEHSLSKDMRLRFLLLGIVIGQFTAEEYATYLSMEKEAVRRIMGMMAERLKNQLIN